MELISLKEKQKNMTSPVDQQFPDLSSGGRSSPRAINKDTTTHGIRK